ncbi:MULTISPECIES: class I SAM-dependent methyltransferase [unclassified Shinella]|uniref:class I SAM-dependent DNA methyltransferase n=1 Tax=unclassified Shinella TaxID=2643062 RepID=UPI00225D6EEA|nr:MULTISPECIES: class I SAM-dependent methyltransferase [unclassified Shinella]MCO5136659.1 class I SAM-dependent methyltransferase [Shinella sp.]MDC7253664.1 class I SAM-dependent methyltransferase [Shinella sp. YE25]CAI0336303.1 SAM-dependent methyltransferase [Rhizobiaceae bacterium]CAK7254845.1 SAM-dependent methyltransferase [Shinella sp. WSC3-e]
MDEADRIAGLYERHADAFDRIRGRDLSEKPWLDRFTAPLAAGAAILDLGCGSGEPLAASLIACGFAVTGVDASQTLVGLCRARHPAHDWYVADMRGFSPGKTFAGILAWHSFFHLTPQDQRAMFPRFAAMAAPGAMLMFTSGPSQGVVVGTFQGEPLYHASLEGAEYRELLAANGFAVVEHRREDPDCGGATVWLARKSG